jgi:hypothetical protein
VAWRRVHAQGFYAPMEDWNLDIRRYLTERIGAVVAASRRFTPADGPFGRASV